jgi:hypothetical protein
MYIFHQQYVNLYYTYFTPPGSILDCSLCSNKPDDDKIVIGCDFSSAINGICKYKYINLKI